MLVPILFGLIPAYCVAAASYIPLPDGATGLPGQFMISIKKGSTSAQVQDFINLVGIEKVLTT